MKTNNPKGLIFFAIPVMLLQVIILHIPAVVLNILIAANLALLILFTAILNGVPCRKNHTASKEAAGMTVLTSILPPVFLLDSFFILMLKIASTRLFLTRESGFDGGMTGFVSGIVSAGGPIGVIAGFCILIAICAIAVFIIKRSNRIIGVSMQSVPDTAPGMTIECSCDRGDINEEAFIYRKDLLQKQIDFLGAADGLGKFIIGNAKVILLIMAVEVFGGIAIETALHGQVIWKAAETSIAYGIGSSVSFLLPLLLLSVSTVRMSMNMPILLIRQLEDAHEFLHD